MYKLENELKSKLHIEYYLHPRTNGDNSLLLSEEHGINTDVMLYCEQHVDDIWGAIMQASQNGESAFLYKDERVQNLFFERLLVRGKIVHGSSRFDLNAAYSPNRSYFDKQNNKFGEIVVVFNVALPTGEWDEVKMRRETIALLSHELNHANEDYRRRIGGKEPVDNLLSRTGYFKNTAQGDENENMYVRKLSFILYRLYKQEINAYVVQIIQEIQEDLKGCDSSEKAWRLIKTTNPWIAYENVEAYLMDIANCKNADIQRKILDYYNSLKQTPTKDFAQMVESLKKKWVKTRKQLLSRLSKQITDAAMKSDSWGYMDGKNVNKTKI